MKIVKEGEPGAENAVDIHEVRYSSNGKRIITTADMYFIVYLTSLWILDYMKYNVKECFKNFDKKKLPIGNRKEFVNAKNFIEREISVKNYISTIRCDKKFYDTQYYFNEFLDEGMQSSFDAIRKPLFEKLSKSGRRFADIMASLIFLDIVYQIFTIYVEEMTKCYSMHVPEFKHLHVIVPNLGRIEDENGEKIVSSHFMKLVNLYNTTFNKGMNQVNLNSKKLGMQELVDKATKKLTDIDFLAKAWDACDKDYVKHGEQQE